MSPEDRHLIEKEQLIFHNLNTCEIKKKHQRNLCFSQSQKFLNLYTPFNRLQVKKIVNKRYVKANIKLYCHMHLFFMIILIIFNLKLFFLIKRAINITVAFANTLSFIKKSFNLDNH